MKANVRGRRPTGVRCAATALAVSGVCAAALVASVITAPASSAAGPATYQFTSGAASFRVSGHTWSLSTGVQSGLTPGGNDLVDIGISTPHRGGLELHNWSQLTIPASDFAVSSTGAATLSSKGSLRPLASLSLTFTPVSHKSEQCTFGRETAYTGKLRGSVRLATHLKGLTLSTSHATFRQPSTLLVDVGCVLKVPPCNLAVWSAPIPENPASTTPIAAGTLAGSEAGLHNLTSVVRNVTTLGSAAPAGAHRQDIGSITAKPPTFNAAKRTLTVSSSSSGVVTGSGRFSHAVAEPPVGPHACTLGSKLYTESEGGYTAVFRSPKARRFTAHTLLTGTFTVPAAGSGGFTIVKLKRK